MENKEPGMAYNTKTLNKVFAVLGVLFLVVVVWMVLDDFIRPWKVVQIKAMEIEKQKIAKELAEVEKSINPAELADSEEQVKIAKANLLSRKVDTKKLEVKLADVQKRIYSQNMMNGVSGSRAGEYQFKYEHALVENHPKSAKEYKEKFDKYKKEEVEGKDHLKALQLEELGVLDEQKALTKDLDDKEKTLAKLVEVRDRLLLGKSKTEKSPVWLLRNSPFLDYLDPTIKIQQLVIDRVSDDRYFQQVPKVDRCTTCHVFIDRKGFEEQTNPYKTHPNLDTLAVGLNSKHPMKEFGCTSCHGGEGHRVNDFSSPGHTPQNKAQEKEWVAKYHWHEPHKAQLMLPLQYTEAACLKCHQGVNRIPMADKLNKGRELMENYSCNGCHKIKGWEHITAEKKPAPSLEKIASKVTKDWAKNWIWAPHAFNPHSRMPAFFMQSNNSKPEFAEKNKTEVNAMVDYLWEKSKDYKPFMSYNGGNPTKGKELVETIGCVGCHQVDGIDEKFKAVNQKKGPYLVHLGSKVKGDWLVSWLKRPSHYQTDTIMPSFRLTDSEANDIASFLLASKNQKFEQLDFKALDKGLRDEILVGYFSQFAPVADAQAKLAKMKDHEKTMELGQRSLGKYGCYSCHQVEGFAADRAPIGPELTFEGSKPITQLGFGQQHKIVPHNRTAWIWHHLENPRRWDIGVPKPFKDLNLMPNFYLSKDEIDSITMAVISQVSDKVPLKGQKTLIGKEVFAEEGRKVANKYNCQGCHKIDGMGGHLLAAFDDQVKGPPYLAQEGHRVRTEWLFDFLSNVHPIRAYTKVRMPSFNFSNKELNKLVAYFQADAEQPIFELPANNINWEPGEREAAAKMFNELACTSCHTQGFNNDEPQAPNLHYAKSRLRPSWIEKWLKNPLAIIDNTVMPAFWGEGNDSAVPGLLGDDPVKQRKALVKYILEMSRPGTPAPFPEQPIKTRFGDI